MSANLENSAVVTGLEKVSFHANHKEKQCQRMLKLPHNCTHLTCQHGEEHDNPLQCSCLENPRDGGAWWAAVYGVAQSRTRLKQLSSSSTCQQSDPQNSLSQPSTGHKPRTSYSSSWIYKRQKNQISNCQHPLDH